MSGFQGDDRGKSQRAKSRFRAGLPAIFHADGQDVACEACDLSRSGVLVVGRLPMPTSPEVEVTVATATGDRSFRVPGRVVHSHEDDELVRLGIQFERLTSEQKDVIDLIVSRVVEGMAPAKLSGIDPRAPVAEVRAALAKVSPAHRLTLASRAADPVERGILKHDTDPHVLEGLARNPHISLPEIKNLLRRSELLPSTLEIIAVDPRWRNDEELKVMVATHPRVTFLTADKVAAQLTDLGRDRLVRRPGLQPGVKQKLMVQLSRKHRGGS